MQKKVNMRLLGIILSAVLLVTLVACSGKTSTTAATTTAATTMTATTPVSTMPATTTSATTTAAPTTAATTATGNVAYSAASVAYTPYTGNFDRTFTYYNLDALSGSGATNGIGVERILKWAADDTNAAGGIVVGGVRYKVAVQNLDNKYDAVTTAQLAQMVVGQYNGKFVGIFGTGPTLAAEDYLSANNVILNAVIAASPLTIGAKYPLVFADSIADFAYGPSTYYPYFINTLGVKTIAIGDTDNDTGRVMSKGVHYAISSQNLNMQVVADEYYTPGTQDFSPLINKFMSLNPDMIDMASSQPSDAALFCKQARDKGYKGILATSVVMGDPAIMWQIAGADSTGYYEIGFFGGDPSAAYTAFRDKYTKTFTDAMPTQCPYNYEHAYNIFKAINQANSFDPYKVASVLQNMTWNYMYGSSAFYGDAPGSLYGIKRVTGAAVPLVQCTTNKNANRIMIGAPPS